MRISVGARVVLAVIAPCFGARESHAQGAEIDLSNVKWISMSAKDTATRFAILHVDSASGATQMIYALAPNTTSPCHWHSASQGSVVAQGAENVVYAGSNAVTLGAGGYSFVPSGTPFRVSTGSSRTVVLVALDGPFDIHVVPAERCASSAAVRESAGRAYEIDFAKVEWMPFPTKASGVRISKLRVDSTSGATHMLFRLPPNAVGPCHWHSASEANFIVQGSASMRHAGMREQLSLGVGGFSFVPARVGHVIGSGPAETLVFSVLDAAFDFHPVEAARCR
jgi:mannose-6-phosphate isomerase-like protein (cupin superfamily)